MEQYILWIVMGAALILFVIIQAVSGNKKPLQSALGYMALGVAALAAVNICGLFIPVKLTVSPLSLLVSAVGGIPGVTLMLFLNMFF